MRSSSPPRLRRPPHPPHSTAMPPNNNLPPVPEDHNRMTMMNRPPMPVPGQHQHNYMNQQGPQLPQRSPSAMAAPAAGAVPPLQRPHSSSQGAIHPTNAYRIYSTDEPDNMQHVGHPPPPPLGPRPGQVPGPESIIPASYDPEAVRAANLSRAEALSAQQREELFVRRASNVASQNQGGTDTFSRPSGRVYVHSDSLNGLQY